MSSLDMFPDSAIQELIDHVASYHTDNSRVVCCLCGSHKDCAACKLQTPTCPDSEDGNHLWQIVGAK